MWPIRLKSHASRGLSAIAELLATSETKMLRETDWQRDSGRVTSLLPVVDLTRRPSAVWIDSPCCPRQRAWSDTFGPSSPGTQIYQSDSDPFLLPNSVNITTMSATVCSAWCCNKYRDRSIVYKTLSNTIIYVNSI